MAEIIETQVAVLGGGPGGYAAAFLAADKGLQVTLIDASPKPGGVCLHCGCIPSKTLLHAAHLITSTQEAGAWGLKFARPEIDLDVLRAKKDKVIDTMASHLLELTKRRQINYIVGKAALLDGQTLQVDNGPRIDFQNCILATGSSTTRLPTFDIGSTRVFTSTSALKLADIPSSLLVVGGGYIGLEMGSVYAGLGSKVTVVELTGSLLPGVDADLVKPLATRLQSLLHQIHLNTKVVRIAEVENGIKATFEGNNLTEKEAIFEKVLIAVGRRPNSVKIGLEKAGVEVTARGFIKVNEQRRTTNPNIFAIGDVAGEPMLAHKAAHEGKLVAQVLAGEHGFWNPRAIPAVVFTDPEIAWCGLTENEAQKQNREVRVGRFPWASSGRATTLGRTDGLTKVLADPKTDELLGVGLVGHGAGELIAEGVVAIEMGATAKDIALSIHPHPTLTETISEAAESLHGLSSHIFVKKPTVL